MSLDCRGHSYAVNTCTHLFICEVRDLKETTSQECLHEHLLTKLKFDSE